MADYGLTNKGINIKRLDEIIEEMHGDLSEAWGINTQQNPASLLNVLITNVADRLSELWELGQDVYNSTYPTTAEGMYLDAVGQFAGIMRETDTPSYYHILCTGTEGTVIPQDTILSTVTNPATSLRPTNENRMLRSAFNTAVVKVVSEDRNPFTIILDGESYSVVQGSETKEVAIGRLASMIDGEEFEAILLEDSSEPMIRITAKEPASSHTMTLSDNLTTDTIGCVFTFATMEDGDIYLPEDSVTEITKAVTGLTSVTNVGTYIAGRLEETDEEFRNSYVQKIFAHSSRMVESIRSAILSNCQGVTSVAVYENESNQVDAYGRYPHSVEVVCDGGDATEIAQQILDTKAAGISTFGNQEISLTGGMEEEIIVRFNRPTYLKLWVRVKVSIAQGGVLPTDYADIIKNIIVQKTEMLECGDDVIPQNLYLPDIYRQVTGVGYVIVNMGVGDEKPGTIDQRNIYASVRERAITDESMIEVVIDG